MVIKSTDAILHGCPYCNYLCRLVPVRDGDTCSEKCRECKQFFYIVGDNTTHSGIGIMSKGQVTYEEAIEHPRKELLARGIVDNPPILGEYFYSRGIGEEIIYGCAFCDVKTKSYIENISGFIKTKEAGLRLLEYFKPVPEIYKLKEEKTFHRQGAYLDYRLHEPFRIQFNWNM